MTSRRPQRRPRRANAPLELVLFLPLLVVMLGAIVTAAQVAVTDATAATAARHVAFQARRAPYEGGPLHTAGTTGVDLRRVDDILGPQPEVDPDGGLLLSGVELPVTPLFKRWRDRLPAARGVCAVVGDTWDHERVRFAPESRHPRLTLGEKVNYFGGGMVSDLASFSRLIGFAIGSGSFPSPVPSGGGGGPPTSDPETGYLAQSLAQVVLGEYSQTGPTALGTGTSVLAGFFGVDLPMDVRDLTHNVTNWEWSWGHAGNTLLNAVAILPVIGSLKYADEAAEVLQGGKKAAYNGGRQAFRHFPRGFKSEAQYRQAMQELKAALRADGIDDALVGVRGSAVTGQSVKGGPFRWGSQGGRPPSDIDVFVESSQITRGVSTSKNIPGFMHPDKVAKRNPAVAEWSQKWSSELGREVSVGGFKPGSVPNHGRMDY